MIAYRVVAAAAAVATVASVPVTPFAQSSYEPATFVGGGVPSLPPLAIGGGEVLVALTIAASGAVDDAAVIPSTPPFTDAVVDAALGWRFAPAVDADTEGNVGPVESKILVAALFRPPTVYGGPARGGGTQETGVAPPEVPYISTLTQAAFPSGALFDAVVLLELQIADDGAVTAAMVASSGGIFDQFALDAVRTWRFQPASRNGTPVPATVVALVGFRQPAQ